MENKKKLIDAHRLLEAYKKIFRDCSSAKSIINNMLCALSTAPTVDAVEVVHGRWIADSWTKWQCDKCHSPSPAYGYPRMEYVKTRYCPNCGAKMDGGNEDGNL